MQPLTFDQWKQWFLDNFGDVDIPERAKAVDAVAPGPNPDGLLNPQAGPDDMTAFRTLPPKDLSQNRTLAPQDMSRTINPADMNRTLAPADMNRTLPPADVNRTLPPAGMAPRPPATGVRSFDDDDATFQVERIPLKA